MTRVGFDQLNENLLQNILSKLPAPSFASAACVSRSCCLACNRILSRPKLASAISLNPFSCHHSAPLVDKFVMDIKRFATSVTHCGSPDAIIIFGLGNGPAWPALYIGVLERRRCRGGSQKGKGKAMISVAFHEVIGGDERDLCVDGVDIITHDAFQFYRPDYNAASSSCHKVSNNLRGYVADRAGDSDGSNKREVIGGLVFACCGRGLPFFGSGFCDVDSSPLTENFPDVPLGGKYCLGEIHRHSSSCGLGGELGRYDQLVYSTVYLVISYIPPPSRP